MDEPCSALDPISTGVIEELIGELRRDLAVVIVTHNLAQAHRVADKVAFMYLGDLVEYGPEELFDPARAHARIRPGALDEPARGRARAVSGAVRMRGRSLAVRCVGHRPVRRRAPSRKAPGSATKAKPPRAAADARPRPPRHLARLAPRRISSR